MILIALEIRCHAGESLHQTLCILKGVLAHLAGGSGGVYKLPVPQEHGHVPREEQHISRFGLLQGDPAEMGVLVNVGVSPDPKPVETVCHKANVVRNRRKSAKNEFLRHVRLYKVHGSLNRFFINNEVVEVDMWIGNAPNDVERVIITPGSSKYEKIQMYRRELQAKADESVEVANGFLFLGYGMNDAHIEKYIVQKIRKERKQAIFVTRDLNDRIEDFAKQNDGVWIVCGLEDPNTGTRIYNNQLGGWLPITGKKLWEFSQFAKEIM